MNRVHRDDVDGMNEGLPPTGTAIVRSLQHVAAVRKRHLEQLAARSLGAESRSARAWSWALGEILVAPVTDRITPVPPSRADIELEVAEADERRDRGERENRADGAASVLRWLIGTDDRLPVRGPNRGELVGGIGEVVRSPIETANLFATVSTASGISDDPEYRQGIAATLRWVLSRQVPGPVSGKLTPELTTRDVKLERLHAQDLDEQRDVSSASRMSSGFVRGAIRAIDWLLGDTCEIPRRT